MRADGPEPPTLQSPGFESALLDERVTIAVPEPELLTEEVMARADALLPAFALEDSPEGPAELRLGKTLGAGGMANVISAEQTALQREVAVKRLRDGQISASTARQLIEEARLTGALEHPNIIPIYALGADSEGGPLLVMKRVEGENWLDLIDAGRALPGAEEADEITAQIGVLLKVCDALRFAHSRGVLHRDIKPSNVMLGPFGEVYLLDWGIATRCPLPAGKADAGGIVGSPGYMAPEMLYGKVAHLDARSDVYLLGATLHRALVGQPRHLGSSARALWESVRASAPFDYTGRLPEELGELLNRACHPDRERRPESVQAFAGELSQFLSHRSSVAEEAAATERLTALQAAVAGGASLSERRLSRQLGACLFAFRGALEAWPGNRKATEGLQAALTLSLDDEIRRGDVEGARQLLAEMPLPTLEQLAQVEQLAREVAEEAAQVEQLRSMQAELKLGGNLRWRLGFALGALIIAVVGPLVLSLGVHAGVWQLSHTLSLISGAVMVALFWAMVLGLGRNIFSNKANARLTLTALSGSGVLLVGRAFMALAGAGVAAAMALDSLLFSVLTLAAAVMVDKRLWPTVPAFIATSFLAVAFPSEALDIIAGGNLVAFSLIGLRWWRPGGVAPPLEGDTPS